MALDPDVSTIKAGTAGVAHVLQQVKTLLSLAALSLIIILLIICFAVFQSPTKSDWLILSMVLAAGGLIGYILHVVSRAHSRGLVTETGPGLATMSPPISNRDGYDMPSTLVVFTFGEPDSDGNYVARLLNVSTVRFLTSGDVVVRVTRSSSQKIVSTESISNPVTAESYGDGTSRGGSSIPFHGVRPGQQELIVYDSVHSVRLHGPRAAPDPADPIRKTLYEQVLKTEHHAYAGTHLVVPTQRVRFLLSFPISLIPQRMTAVRITEQGDISQAGFRMERVADKNMWIVECDNADRQTGVWACWVWPHEEKV